MRIRAIAFDLDGTLVDSAGGVTRALNAALQEAGLPCFDVRQVRGWIGDGPDVLIERALRTLDLPCVDSAQRAARMRRDFDAATLAAPFADSTVYEGMQELLQSVGREMPLVVVTNKPTRLASAVLEGASLLRHFRAVHGADAAEMRKPSPRLIQQAALGLEIDAQDMLMVGDAASDWQAAHAAGSRAAWAAWGYGTADMRHVAQVWRLDRPAQLLAYLGAPAEGATGPAPSSSTSRDARSFPPEESPR